MNLSQFLTACLLTRSVNAVNVPGAPNYLGATWRSVVPDAPRIQGSSAEEAERGFFEALKTPNVTGIYSFGTPNISAPIVPGIVTEESNNVLPGWSLSVAVRTGIPYPTNGQYFTAGEVYLHMPQSLLTNVTEGGQKNISVLDEWDICVIQWDLGSRPYPFKMRSDDGTCSSVLSPDCIREVRLAAQRNCRDPNVQDIPACAKDNTAAFQTTSVSGYFPAESMRKFPQGRAQLMAFTTETIPGAQNVTSYNDMGTVAWPVLFTVGLGHGSHGKSGLFCIRPNKIVNGSTLPVWENKEEKGGKEGEGQDGDEGKDGGKSATVHTDVGKASVFVLSAATLAFLVL
ncbi:endo-1-4-beta-xylanase B [Apiospora arundinis]